jgi:hypothetical protein
MSIIGDPTLPEVGDGYCCAGAAERGREFCTCWETVYDRDQAEVQPGFPTVRAGGMCSDCAYRPGSPEKDADPEYGGDPATLEAWAEVGAPFHCHDGMRRRVELRHPAGAVVPGHPADYDPPIQAGVPYRADGQPGYLCAGWDARRRALAARDGGDRS